MVPTGGSSRAYAAGPRSRAGGWGASVVLQLSGERRRDNAVIEQVADPPLHLVRTPSTTARD
jgi:hypothetical protein